MRRVLLLLTALSSIQFLRTQSIVSGPVVGFKFDAPTRSIRAVIGSLGSASLGPPAVGDLDFASMAPHQNYGVALRRGQVLLVSQLGSGRGSVASLSGLPSAPDGVVWSGDGSVAVLYSETGGWIQTFTGFPAAATPGSLLGLSPLGGSVSAITTDLHGQRIAIGVTGDHAGVYGIESGQGFVPWLNMPGLNVPGPAALAFSEDGGTLYALDGVANQISELDLASFATRTWPLGTQDAVAIHASPDASNLKVLYVAGGNDRLLLAFDRSTHQQVASVPLSFTPTMIEPLGNGSFLLRSRTSNSDPLWSFTNGSQPLVYFVPATPLPPDLGTSHEVRPR